MFTGVIKGGEWYRGFFTPSCMDLQYNV